MLARIAARRRSVNIAIVGKYTRLHDAYLSVMESLYHAGYETGAVVHIKWVEAEEVNPYTADDILRECDGILVPGGFGDRGIEGYGPCRPLCPHAGQALFRHLSGHADRCHRVCTQHAGLCGRKLL